jgi:hypothetical protein
MINALAGVIHLFENIDRFAATYAPKPASKV